MSKLKLDKPSTNSISAVQLASLLSRSDAAQLLGVKVSIIATWILAAINLAVQGYTDVRLPHGQIVPISCYFMSIADSGERKTTCDHYALRATRDYESQLRRDYDVQMAQWKNACDVWEHQRAEILRDKQRSKEEKTASLSKLGDRPSKPLQPVILCSDPTVEGIHKMMFESQQSIGVFSSEASQLICGYGMNSDNKLKTAGALSELWDGTAHSRVRSLDGVITVCDKRISIHLLGQPDVCMRLFADNELRNQGLISRLLVVYPESTMGRRLFKCTLPDDHLVLTVFYERISTVLAARNGKAIMSIDSIARDVYIELHDAVEKSLTSKYGCISGSAAKAAEHGVRLAASLAIFEDTSCPDNTDRIIGKIQIAGDGPKRHGSAYFMDIMIAYYMWHAYC